MTEALHILFAVALTALALSHRRLRRKHRRLGKCHDALHESHERLSTCHNNLVDVLRASRVVPTPQPEKLPN